MWKGKQLGLSQKLPVGTGSHLVYNTYIKPDWNAATQLCWWMWNQANSVKLWSNRKEFPKLLWQIFFKISSDWYSFGNKMSICWHSYWPKWQLSLTLKLTAASFIHGSSRIRDQQLYVPVRLTPQVWASSRGWWWTGKPGMLQSVGSQRVRHNWVTELNWSSWNVSCVIED